MQRIASSDSDHRRGLVLGLTMAEVLILLLFVLLLAAAAAMHTADRTVATLRSERDALVDAVRPVVEAFREQGLSPEQVIQEVLPQAAAQRQLEEEARRVNPDAPPAATLRYGLDRAADPRTAPARLADLEVRNRTLADLEAQARRIEPNAPPAQTIQASLLRQQRSRTAVDDQQTATGVLAVVRDTERRLGERLREEFGPDLARWNGDIDSGNLSLRFNNPDILFAPGQASLRPTFQTFLREFFPRYLDRLSEFRDDIDEVRIEGHTSTEWGGAVSPLDAYFRNMELSQERTREVLRFGLSQTAVAPELRNWAQSRITANGLSSSRIRQREDGTEDRDASRRVEFRVILRLRERMMQVLPGN